MWEDVRGFGWMTTDGMECWQKKRRPVAQRWCSWREGAECGRVLGRTRNWPTI